MKNKEYNPLQVIGESVAGAATVVGKIAEKTDQHTKPIFTYVRERMVERAVRMAQKRVAKASWNYRVRR